MKCLCPHCHQPMREVFGIRFTPKQAEMLCMIRDVTKGRGGIEMESLISVFYPGVSRHSARKTVATHISAINEMLALANYRIVSNDYRRGGARYRLVKFKEQAA